MEKIIIAKKTHQKSETRSNKDRIMILTGILLVILFLIIGYVSIESKTEESKPKNRGPVKNPVPHESMDKRSHDTFPDSFKKLLALEKGQIFVHLWWDMDCNIKCR